MLGDTSLHKSQIQDIFARAPNPLMAVSNTVVLVLAIPPLVVTTPPLPITLSLRRATNLPIPKLIIYLLIPALSLLPAHPSAILSDIILVLALASTYILPGMPASEFSLHSSIIEFNASKSCIARNDASLQAPPLNRDSFCSPHSVCSQL